VKEKWPTQGFYRTVFWHGKYHWQLVPRLFTKGIFPQVGLFNTQEDIWQ